MLLCCAVPCCAVFHSEAASGGTATDLRGFFFFSKDEDVDEEGKFSIQDPCRTNACVINDPCNKHCNYGILVRCIFAGASSAPCFEEQKINKKIRGRSSVWFCCCY